jgi:sec-independent protein translocase protein TatC
MATEPEEIPSEQWEEEGGGPVKGFLDHLEDLRWTLVKVFSSILISMFVCLVAGNYVVKILRYPLDRAGMLFGTSTNAPLVVVFGTNYVGEIPRSSLADYAPAQDSNLVAMIVVPRLEGTNVMLGLEPATNIQNTLKNLPIKTYSPLSGPMVAIKIALYGGLVLGLPFSLFFIAEFVFPALKKREKTFVKQALVIGGGLFVLGVLFCYFVLLPIALAGAIEFSKWLGFVADEWRAEDFISFICIMLLVVGVSFELPIPILLLVKLGILDYRTLGKFRPYWVVAELVICAMLTPSADPFTMVLMALPLHALYEISFLIAWYWAWRDRRREASAS